MDETSLLGAVLGAIVGLILALTGAGGGVLAVPLLVFGLHLTIHQAAPVGLVAVGLSAAVGAVLGLREGIVRYRAAAMIGIVGIIAAPAGLWLAQRIANAPLTIAFAAVLAYVSARMFRQASRSASGGDALRPPPTLPCVVSPEQGRLAWTLPCARALAGTGAVSGLLTGMLGVGGGFVIVPALTRYTDLQIRSIVATSLAVIAIVSAGSVAAAAATGAIRWAIAAPFAVGALLGLFAGRGLAKAISGPRLQQTFAVVGILVALLLSYRGVSGLIG